MRPTLQSLIRSSVVASLVSMGLWYACPAAAADATAPIADPTAKKDGPQSPPRPEIRWTPPEKNLLVPEPAAPAIKAQNEDYYSRRAKKILEAERSAAATLHPLAAANADEEPVVCDAGCSKEHTAEIVYSQPKTTVAGKFVPTSASPGDDAKQKAAAAPSIDCIAGCYEGEKSWLARPAQPKVSTALAAPPAESGEKPKAEKPPTKKPAEVERKPARDHLSPVR